VRGVVRLEEPAPPNTRVVVQDDRLDRLLPDGLVDERYVVDADRGLKDVFVYVSGGHEDWVYRPRTDVRTLEFRRGRLLPRIFGVQPGETLACVNADADAGVEHRLRSTAVDLGDRLRYDRAKGIEALTCERHPFERAWAGVLEHPLWSVTAFGGMYELPKMPPGRYRITAWHEGCFPASADVDVPPEGNVTLDLSLRLRP